MKLFENVTIKSEAFDATMIYNKNKWIAKTQIITAKVKENNLGFENLLECKKW